MSKIAIPATVIDPYYRYYRQVIFISHRNKQGGQTVIVFK